MTRRLSIAFVGTVVPDEERFRGRAFSRAGNMFQTNVLEGLVAEGASVDAVLSARPLPSFPRGKRVWVSPEEVRLANGLPVRLVGYLNVTPLKQITVAVTVVLGLFVWAWRHRADRRVVVTWNLSVPPGLALWLAARLTGAALVAIVGDVEVPGETVPDRLLHRLDAAAHGWVMRRLTGLVAVSDAIARELAPGHPFLRMDGGVANETLAAFPPRCGASAEDFTFVFAGRLDRMNGIDVVLEAFRLLGPGPYRLVFAGAGPLAAAVENAARDDPRISCIGFVTLERVFELYRSAGALLCIRSTRIPGSRFFFPSKMLEYLASRAPVMATCTGHLASEYGEYVHLVRDETPSGVADVMRTLVSTSQEELRRRAEAARAYVEGHKTWSAQSRRLLRYIETVVVEPDAERLARSELET